LRKHFSPFSMSDSWPDRRQFVASYYDELIRTYGHQPRACDYGRPESQRRKFEVLCEALPLDHMRVLDVGCGFADFADYLAARFAGVSYEGVDITPRMIEEARKLHPDQSLRVLDILTENPGGPYDFVTANGIFYLLGEHAEERMQQLIARMFELCTTAVAFNSLSSWAPKQEPGEFYADPLATVAFCKTLTPWVALRHDYFPHDFTVYLYRRQRA